MDDNIARLKTAAELIREERRYYNNMLNKLVETNGKEYNIEDLARLVGQLECAYNHALASIETDANIYCLIKHLSTALVLAGEMDNPRVGPIYDMLTIISNGLIAPCESCKREESL